MAARMLRKNASDRRLKLIPHLFLLVLPQLSANSDAPAQRVDMNYIYTIACCWELLNHTKQVETTINIWLRRCTTVRFFVP